MAYKPIPLTTPEVQAILDNRKTMTRRVVKKKYSNTDLEMKTDKYGTRLIERQNDAPPPEPVTFPDGRKGTRWSLVAIRDVPSPYQRGDILWVRETWQQLAPWTDNGCGLDWDKMQYYYAADGNPGIEMTDDNGFPLESFRWRPSIHMPKAAARIFLRVTDVRAERVQDITEENALKEGVPSEFPMDEAYCPVCMGEGLVGAVHPASLGFMEIDCPHCETAKQRFGNLWQRLNAKRGYGWDANPWVWAYTFERIATPEGWPECV